MEREDFEFFEQYQDLMRAIIVNHSSSDIPMVFRDRVFRLNSKWGYHNTCTTCNAGLYLAVARVQDKYVEYKMNNQSNDGSCNKRTRKRKKSEENTESSQGE